MLILLANIAKKVDSVELPYKIIIKQVMFLIKNVINAVRIN